jgi:hypothetical protein
MIKIEQVKLSQVKTNADNPRSITKTKHQKLINSLLVFPAMLEIRPVVVDNKMKALGGNQRLDALKSIAKMPVEEIAERLASATEYQERTPEEKKQLVEHWGKWLDNPTVFIINAKHLTEAERKQFVIKDNVSFGTWDYDALANKWDNNKLEDWGMDVWRTDPTADYAESEAATNEETDDQQEPEGDPLEGLQDALPPELQGRDLNPTALPTIKGEDDTPSEHIIITYTAEEREALAELLGMEEETLFSKICWRFDELTQHETTEEEESHGDE